MEVAGIRDQGGGYDSYEDSGYIPNDHDLIEADHIVISFRDEQDMVHYVTLPFGVDGWDGLEDALADIYERYGEPA